jgi:hypothetical protein
MVSLQDITILGKATVWQATRRGQELKFVWALCGHQTRWSATAGLDLFRLRHFFVYFSGQSKRDRFPYLLSPSPGVPAAKVGYAPLGLGIPSSPCAIVQAAIVRRHRSASIPAPGDRGRLRTGSGVRRIAQDQRTRLMGMLEGVRGPSTAGDCCLVLMVETELGHNLGSAHSSGWLLCPRVHSRTQKGHRQKSLVS